MVTSEDLYNVMKSRPDIFTPMADDELKHVQEESLRIFLEFQDFCVKRNLTIMLGGGSVLGPLRHNGFIPWDDDIDVFMPRKDYNLLLYKYADELPNYFKISAPNGKGLVAQRRHAMLFDTRTKKYSTIDSSIENNIEIDIFPLENYITNKLKRSIIWPIYVLLSTAATTSVLWCNRKKKNTYNQSIILSEQGIREYKVRLFIGFLTSFLPYYTWLNLTDKLIRSQSETGLVYIPSIFGSVNRPIDKSVFTPTVWGKFGDKDVLFPNQPEKYLEWEYGNWRELPPIEKQRQHNFRLK